MWDSKTLALQRKAPGQSDHNRRAQSFGEKHHFEIWVSIRRAALSIPRPTVKGGIFVNISWKPSPRVDPWRATQHSKLRRCTERKLEISGKKLNLRSWNHQNRSNFTN
jgi:hypothetical protein